jgi:hypothetical protein
LELLETFRPLKQGEDGAFNDKIIQIQLKELLS